MDMEQMSKALSDAQASLEALAKRVEAAEKAKLDADNVIKAKDAEIVKLKADTAEAIAKGGKTADEQDADFLKALTPAVRERVLAERATNAANAAAIAKMQTEKEESVAIEKAKGYGVGDATKIGQAMVRVAKGKATAEDVTLIEGALAQAGRVQKSGALFASLGSGAAVEGDPEALLQAKADEIAKSRKKPEGGAFSKAEAYDVATQENPQLYAAYIAKRRNPAASTH